MGAEKKTGYERFSKAVGKGLERITKRWKAMLILPMMAAYSENAFAKTESRFNYTAPEKPAAAAPAASSSKPLPVLRQVECKLSNGVARKSEFIFDHDEVLMETVCDSDERIGVRTNKNLKIERKSKEKKGRQQGAKAEVGTSRDMAVVDISDFYQHHGFEGWAVCGEKAYVVTTDQFLSVIDLNTNGESREAYVIGHRTKGAKVSCSGEVAFIATSQGELLAAVTAPKNEVLMSVDIPSSAADGRFIFSSRGIFFGNNTRKFKIRIAAGYRDLTLE